ncbi:MAG: PH domain-containing protein [Flavobacteriales bacterium]|nr:PH domain-containing protein [Flavobacteriales bacterium]
MEENEIWKGTPSQWTNFGTYVMCVLFCWLVIPIFIAIWSYLVIRTWSIQVTDERIIEEKGVLSKTINELELFRVKDIRIEQPFFLRLVGLSNIILVTSDRTNKIYRIPAIENGKELKEEIRKAVDIRRDKKRVRETDFE